MCMLTAGGLPLIVTALQQQVNVTSADIAGLDLLEVGVTCLLNVSTNNEARGEIVKNGMIPNLIPFSLLR